LVNKFSRAFAAASLLLVGSVGADRANAAENVAQFYKGKTVTAMVGFSPGGTDDMWTRLIALHIGSHIPGNPTVVPQNVPGAGSLLLANQIYNTQPEDGTVFGLINRGLPFEKLLKGPGVLFDPQKISYVGSPDIDTGICAARTDGPVKTVEDLRTKSLVVGSTGSGADSAIYPQVLSSLLGLKFKIVNGYPGSSDISLAVERNEVQGECVSYITVARSAPYRDGKVKFLFQLAAEPDPHIPDVPLVSTLAQTDAQKASLNLFIMRVAVGRPFVAGPKVPADRLAALRQAFADTVKDPAFVADAKKAGLTPHYVSPEKISSIVAQAYAAPPDAVANLTKAFGR
jgi:tripartite-type tricarboxylate transporter receptor subunit TctC